MYVTRDYYVSEYGGAADEKLFQRYNAQAQSMIDYYTLGRIGDITSQGKDLQTAIKFAVCEVIDLIKDTTEKVDKQKEDKRISSESVGAYTVSFKYGDEMENRYQKQNADVNQQVYAVCKRYLGHTGLMYRGVKANG